MIRGVGKSMRMKRVIDHAGASVICALDHGMTSPQFLEPLADIATRTAEAVAGGANVIMMSKGTSLALLLSASANPEQGEPEVVQIAEVEEAARLGADAVVLFTALGGQNEPGMVRMLAGVGRACESHGIPFIAEAEFPTTYASVDELKQRYGFEYLRRNVRLCAELGADIVMAVQPTENEAAAMDIEHHRGLVRRRTAVDADRDAVRRRGNGGRLRRHALRVAGEELAAHPVVDRALLGDRVVDRVGRVIRIGPLDEGPGLGVDEGFVVGHAGSAPRQG